MRLTKQKRQQVYEKTNGRCWYCGCDLDGKWHADHKEPVVRLSGGTMLHPERDCDENLVPACHPCNLHKHDAGLDRYRRIINDGREQFIKSGKGKALLRMGLAEISDAPVVFWGEQKGI